MKLIGGWSDLCAYYAGSDGNCWSYHMAPLGWSNNGPVDQFKERIKAGRFRGELLPDSGNGLEPCESEKEMDDSDSSEVYWGS